ncbi:MAG: DUF362 domain-containing protein [Candidatus Aminicenantales bacterium]
MSRHNRRDFLKQLLFGTAGLVGGLPAFGNGAEASSVAPPPSAVYFRTGSERRRMIQDVLSPLEEEVRSAVDGRSIVIKPNFVVSGRPLCATHVDAARGVLDFLKKITDRQVLIAESPASADAARCFEQYGYTALTKEYNVRLVDLNAEPTVEVGRILQSDGTTASARIIETLLDRRNYVISLSLPKTHDTVVATLTTKNMIMAAPWAPGRLGKSHKVVMHGGKIDPRDSEFLTKNMFLLADRLRPDLAVLDGFEGMEGNGPVGGIGVPHRIALAGTDCIAVDAIGAKLMGIEPRFLQYLAWCGNAGLGNFDEKMIRVDGPAIDGFVKAYRMHETFEVQTRWIRDLASVAERRSPLPLLHVEPVDSSSSAARIEFRLPLAMEARLEVIDAQGRRIRRILARKLDAGGYRLAWDGRGDSGLKIYSGSCFVRLQAGTASVRKPLGSAVRF